MSSDAKRPGVWFWLVWVFGSGAAFAGMLLVGFIVSTAVLGLLGYKGPEIEEGAPFAFYLTAAFALGGAGIGVVRWLLLRRRIQRAGWWVLSWAVNASARRRAAAFS